VKELFVLAVPGRLASAALGVVSAARCDSGREIFFSCGVAELLTSEDTFVSVAAMAELMFQLRQ
jgi:hypothetical protein